MRLLLSFILFLSFTLLHSQLTELEFGSDESLEIVTWNLENFPKKGSITRDSVAVIIEALDVDIIALQEIEDKGDFNDLLAKLPQYDGFFDPNFFGGLAYIYKESTINVIDIFEIYTNNSFWNAFPRAPFVLEFSFNGKKMYCINNHLKCCGDGTIESNNNGDEEWRRLKAVRLLKEYIDEELDDELVFLVGDLNDILTDNSSKNVFQEFLDEPTRYQFADMQIAQGSSSNWSFPNWPSHLDHILITDELFEAFEANDAETKTIKIDQFLPGGFNQYDNNITDHRPVGISLNAGIISSIHTEEFIEDFTITPNPATDEIRIRSQQNTEIRSVTIYSIVGQQFSSEIFRVTADEVLLNVTTLPTSLYYVRIETENGIQVLSLVKN